MRQFLQLLERAFRRFVVYPVFRLVFREQIFDDTIDLARVRKLLILRHDRIGDMIITTPIFRNLKLLRPDLHIGVFGSPTNVEIVRHNPYVDDVYVLYSNVFRLLREIRRARHKQYDLVLSFVFNRTTTVALLARLAGPEALRVDHADEKYQFYFNRLVKTPRYSVHMAELLAAYLKEVFGVELPQKDLQFEIYLDELSKSAVDRFLEQHHLRRRSDHSSDFLPYIVCNLSATLAERRISLAQASALAGYVGRKTSFRTVLIHSPNDHVMGKAARTGSEFKHCLIFPRKGIASLLEIASLIEGAFCVLTPDTAIIHFASAARTPVLGFYATSHDLKEWLPFRVPHDLLMAPLGQPVSSIPIEQMLHRTDEFLEKSRTQLTTAPSSPSP